MNRNVLSWNHTPVIARKLLREDRPEIQRVLQEVLYLGEPANGNFNFTRLLLCVSVDLDAVPEDGDEFRDGLICLMSD